MQVPGDLFLRLVNENADMRAAAWESALGQTLRLSGGDRGRALTTADLAALADGLTVQDLPAGANIPSAGEPCQSHLEKRMERLFSF